MYIDAGIGSILIQGLLAALAFGSIMLVTFRRKLSALFRKLRGLPPIDEAKEQDYTEIVDNDFDKMD